MSGYRTIKVCAINGNYDILIGKDLLSTCLPEGNYAVVTDETVFALYGGYFDAKRCIVLPPGEQSKNLDHFKLILNRLMDMNLGRKDTLISLGGGVIGDIAGFAAASFKRGMRLLQIPTTLLAQVDSSVGGKVAVNLEKGKNMVGTFYQPCGVYADTDVLKTLNTRQYAAGMAEVIKYAFIADEQLYHNLCQRSSGIEEMISSCCKIKARYVMKDPYDHGIRMHLNYGHTIGHAIETVAGYGRYLHGEAVAIGMVCAAVAGEVMKISPSGLADDTIRLLRQYGLPVQTDHDILKRALKILTSDKKVEKGTVYFVLIDKIGRAALEKLPVSYLAQVVEKAIL
jgi:3-dehydroquinate synthase